jgi:hypothetical protein
MMGLQGQRLSEIKVEGGQAVDHVVKYGLKASPSIPLNRQPKMRAQLPKDGSIL